MPYPTWRHGIGTKNLDFEGSSWVFLCIAKDATKRRYKEFRIITSQIAQLTVLKRYFLMQFLQPKFVLTFTSD
ncbi:hypothetical protein, partial [Herbaspirillum sp. RV1423]|uniref:hypothetical protein n=1 Tax=Herbaspirillum sp. RV1423 TaxID=1443993 RepID=UPI001E5264C4